MGAAGWFEFSGASIAGPRNDDATTDAAATESRLLTDCVEAHLAAADHPAHPVHLGEVDIAERNAASTVGFQHDLQQVHHI
jgi:hypothetical protein